MSTKPDTKAVASAIPAVRELLRAAGMDFRIVGGIAVVHHGYERFTEDIDVLIELVPPGLLDALLAAHGFVRSDASRLRHQPSGVQVDLLVAGTSMPRPDSPCYPSPSETQPSPRDPEMIGLGPLLELKLWARRHKDFADVVELLKRVDDSSYIALESSLPASLRPELSQLRRDALEELSFER